MPTLSAPRGLLRFLTLLIVLSMLLGGLPAVPNGYQVSAQEGGGPDIGDPPDLIESIWPEPGDDAIGLAVVPASVDISTRESSRAFYNSYFQPSMPSVGWTGNYANCTPGTSSAAYRSAILDQIVWYRAMAGVPANVTLSSTYNAKAQQAAQMMGRANQLSHYPGAGWPCYTAAGAEAAAASNLDLWSWPTQNNVPSSWDPVTDYIRDQGSNNASVGHRRWMLYPQTQTFGTGDTAGPNGSGYSFANAIWVQDGRYRDPRPATRDGFVAWPPPGYVPYQTTFARWSFSYPGADFSNAVFSVTRDGAPVPFEMESYGTGAGEPTAVWRMRGLDSNAAWPKPGVDERYTVTIANLAIGGVITSVSYDVIVFDPAVAGSTPATPKAVVSPMAVPGGSPVNYTLTNFPANSSVQITWYGPGNVVQNLGTVTTNGSGSRSGTVTLPIGPGGLGELRFVSGAAKRSVYVAISPTFEITSDYVVTGQQVPFRVTGLGPYASYSVAYWLAPNSGLLIRDFQTGADGAYTGTFPSYAGITEYFVWNMFVPDTVTLYAGPSVEAGADKTAEATNGVAQVPLSANATTPVGTIVKYEWSYSHYDAGGDWVTDVIGTGSNPTVTLPIGSHWVIVEVTDSQGGKASDGLTVDVQNDVPELMANAGPDQTLTPYTPTSNVWLSAAGSTTQPGTSITSYTWRENGTIIGTGFGLSVSLGVGVHTIELTVTNNLNQSTTDTVVITIANPDPPAPDAGLDQVVIAGSGGTADVELRVNGYTFYDTVAWSIPGFTIEPGEWPVVTLPIGTYVATVTVTDPLERTASDSVEIRVAAQSTKVVANAGPDIEVFGRGDVSVQLNGAGTTTSGGATIVEYRWIYYGTDGWPAIAYGVSPTITINGWGQQVELVVIDSEGRASTDEVGISVNHLSPPVARAGADQTVDATGTLTPITLDGSASTATYAPITTYIWFLTSEYGRYYLASGPVVTVHLPPGEHEIGLEVWDSDFLVQKGTDTLTVTINEVLPAASVTSRGTVGSDVDYSIAGYAANQSVQIAWQPPSGSPISIGTRSANSQGLLTGSFAVPVQAGGHGHTITFTGGGRTLAFSFEIEPTIIPSVASAAPGQQITLSLRGFKANDDVVLLWKTPTEDVSIGFIRTSGTGSYNGLAVTVPANAAKGPNTIIAMSMDHTSVSNFSSTPVTVIGAASASVLPTRTTVGSKVDYTITEFPANTAVTITWKRPGGATVKTWSVQTNASGAASGTIEVPATVGGTGHQITFSGGGVTKTAAFEVAPRIRPQVTSAAPGQTVLINLRGFAANDPVTIKWKVGSSFVTVGTVTTSGTGSVTDKAIVVPANAQGGMNTLRVEGTINQQSNAITIVAPAVTLSTQRTTVNAKVTATITNFPANSTVTVSWRRQDGTILPNPNPVLPTFQTDATGSVVGSFKVPATTGGTGHQVVFSAGGVSRSVAFEIAPRVKVTPAPAARGEMIDISLRGFARQEAIRIRWRLEGTATWIVLATGTTSNTGSANIKIPVPAYAIDGTYQLRAETTSFNQQTNVVRIAGGVPVQPAEAPATTPEPESTPVTIDRSALPLEAPVELGTIIDEANTPELKRQLTDGDLATGWSGTPDAIRQDARLTIDLGERHALRGFGWLTETGGCGQLTGLEYSVDGETWTAVDPYLQPGAIGEGMVWRYQPVTEEARYLRFTVAPETPEQTTVGCLAEVAVWGTRIEPEAVIVETPVPTETPIAEPTPTPEETPVVEETPTPEEPEATLEPTPETPAETVED